MEKYKAHAIYIYGSNYVLVSDVLITLFALLKAKFDRSIQFLSVKQGMKSFPSFLSCSIATQDNDDEI
jgi:hypothetical protein